ncbi:hypothetical protein CCR94_11665 [Rhodoblastus sphagnicola]|uniref:histidine kinase n=1 Tax=Rhodoblastus sphagnicola TaxID=333368 RepID=A0A2S6N7Y2_9HYPH|nr:ATP-binding protein [Rhodoblastus sphagnicola]MBB4197819.1 two-component system sensor histidine kinase RpfC [Rhodoblastus sphagnicola]PPQ30716.1 hypothetical protein CCR94_11665 [Rhodoblastus sphagnicola]
MTTFLSTIGASLSARFEAKASDERAVMRNRFGLAGVALCAAVVASLLARGEGEAAAFLRAGLPILLAHLVGSAILMAHIAWRPATSAPRLALALTLDGLAITAAMIQGGGAAAYLFPLYWWMILGAGARFGAAFLAFTVALAALGFAGVVATTPFWRGQDALAASLMLSLVVLPLYGALLLRQIAMARAGAERASRAKTLFLASVSHELRTPLTAIVGLTGLLEKSRLDSEQRDMARTLGDAAETLLAQVEHLLSGAREEFSPEVSPEIGEAAREETIDLFALLITLRALLAVEAEAKGVSLGLMIEAETPRHIRADRRRLQEIFQNVAGNAVKFTGEGAVAIRVGARREAGGLWLHVEVRDTGPGVALEAQDRIFEPFSQGDPSMRQRFGGAGLGLAIVRRGLEAMGGDIALDSRPGQGAMFRLRWPVVEAEGTAAPGTTGLPVCLPLTEDFDSLEVARRHALAVLACGEDAPSLARARKIAAEIAALRGAANPRAKILLAEDNAVNGRVLEKILTGAGHEARVVRDGAAALLALLREDFDFVLLDVNMPRLGGVETARIYAAASGRAPMLALTADDSAETRRRCRAAGMVACLRKPISPEALLAALDAAATAAPMEVEDDVARARKRDSATLDPATLAALGRLGGAEFVRELLVQFAGDAAHLVEDIHASLARGDVASLRRQAHALESMAGNTGAAALARLCRAWREMNERKLALSAARESGRLRRRWRMTLDALGRALVQT